MKNILVLSTLALSLSLTGCSGSTPWPPQNVIQQVQSFESTVQIALNGAQVAWTFVQPFLPAANAAQITQQFENAVNDVNHALNVLNDALAAAQAAGQANPDLTAVMQAVSDAVGQVLAIIAQYQGGTGTADAGVGAGRTVPGYADALHAATQLKAYIHH